MIRASRGSPQTRLGLGLLLLLRGRRVAAAAPPPPPFLHVSNNSPIATNSTLCYPHNNSKSRFLFKPPSPSSLIMMNTGASAAGFSTVPFENGGDSNNVFSLSPSSLLKINKGDITKWSVDGSSDAIFLSSNRPDPEPILNHHHVSLVMDVNPANERMLGGGGADGAIHRAAGPQLRDACYTVPEVQPGVRCPTGEARITPGFNLPASHVIHTVGPIYEVDGNPEASLRNAYRNSLTVAKDNNIKYIAFPAISCGVYGYPYEEAAAVAISTVKEFTNDLKVVHFLLFSDELYNVWLEKAKEVFQA